jgi:hypothetical protein
MSSEILKTEEPAEQKHKVLFLTPEEAAEPSTVSRKMDGSQFAWSDPGPRRFSWAPPKNTRPA